jgi:hypothetical protein
MPNYCLHLTPYLLHTEGSKQRVGTADLAKILKTGIIEGAFMFTATSGKIASIHLETGYIKVKFTSAPLKVKGIEKSFEALFHAFHDGAADGYLEGDATIKVGNASYEVVFDGLSIHEEGSDRFVKAPSYW